MTDDKWLTDIHCPQSFNFETILSTPAADGSDNPPLLDSAWESDEDTHEFFKSLNTESINRHPSRSQKNVPFATDIRLLGPPRYQNRPTIPFEEYVRLHESDSKEPDSVPRPLPNHGQKAVHNSGGTRSKSVGNTILQSSPTTISKRPQSSSRQGPLTVQHAGIWRPPVRKTSQNNAQRISPSHPVKSSAGSGPSPNAPNRGTELVSTVSSCLAPLPVSPEPHPVTNPNAPALPRQLSKSPPPGGVRSDSKPAVVTVRNPRRAQEKESQLSEPSTSLNVNRRTAVSSNLEPSAIQAPTDVLKMSKSSIPPVNKSKSTFDCDLVSRKRNFSQQRCKSFNGVDSRKTLHKSDNLETSSRVLQVRSRQGNTRAKSEYRKTVVHSSSQETQTTDCGENEDLNALLEARNALIIQQRLERKIERQKSLERMKEQVFETFRRAESKITTKTSSLTEPNLKPNPSSRPSVIASRQCISSTKVAKPRENVLTRRIPVVQKNSRKVLSRSQSRSHAVNPQCIVQSSTSDHENIKNNSRSTSPDRAVDLQPAMLQHNQSVTGRRRSREATDG